MNYSQSDHTDEDTLERYALGRLSEDEAAPVEEHLLICHSCQDRLAEADEFIRTVRAAAPTLSSAPQATQESFWQTRKRLWIPALAAVVLIAIVVQYLLASKHS